MSSGKVFLVVPAHDREMFEKFGRKNLAYSRRDSLHILTDESKNEFSTDVRTRVGERIISSIDAIPVGADDILIVHRNTNCNIDELIDEWKSSGRGSSNAQKMAHQAIKRQLTEHWQNSGDHWRTYAAAELRKYEGRSTGLEQWTQQFDALGYPDVGRKLAARLCVVRLGEMQEQPFSSRPADAIGQRQLQCYVKDDDDGGSWVEIQNILTHSHPPASVKSVTWDKSAGTLAFPDETGIDQVILYEDGLWSGHEAVERLQALGTRSKQVVMKYGIVTDFGLLVARHAIRSLNLTESVTIETSSSKLMRFLPENLPEELRVGNDYEREDYYRALHDHAIPDAFKSGEDWNEAEQEACRVLGAQLVQRWLDRGGKGVPSEAKVAKFALGGGRFASTTVFSRSVPKVCLPLLWLDGAVELDGKAIEWKPLFVDARRIADHTLLFATE